MIRTLSFTGHRPDKLGGYHGMAAACLRYFARERIEEVGPERAISGMALGWDTACAWACVDLGVPFVAAVPFVGQERRWSAEQQREYHVLLSHAADVAVVCHGGFHPAKMMRRNEWMVDHSDAVLSLWNGSRGGTANCVSYAHRRRKPVIAAWPKWENRA